MLGLSVLCGLASTLSGLQAQPADDADVSFDQRFSVDTSIAPTFTRPEVIELLQALPFGAVERVASAEMTADEPERPPALGQIILAEPKGPAKVLQDLLNTPVQELLVPRAEAGPEVPPPAEAQQAVSAAPQAGSPAEAAVPARAAHPLSERPPAQNIASIPAPDPGQGAAPDQPAGPPLESRVEVPSPAAPPGPPESSPGVGPVAAAREVPPSEGATMARPRERTAEPRVSSAGRPQVTRPDREGRPLGSARAAWYEHPGRTASGERYDPDRLTAAHRTLPFGTMLRVLNEETGRSVVVRINDRVPDKAARKRGLEIDLSRASAKTIGLADVGRVSLYELDPAPYTHRAEPYPARASQRRQAATRDAAVQNRGRGTWRSKEWRAKPMAPRTKATRIARAKPMRAARAKAKQVAEAKVPQVARPKAVRVSRAKAMRVLRAKASAPARGPAYRGAARARIKVANSAIGALKPFLPRTRGDAVNRKAIALRVRN